MGIGIISRGTKGAKVFQDDQKPWKVYGGFGEGLREFHLSPGLPADDTTNTPTNFICTAVGTSPVTVGVADGFPLLVTTGGTEYDGQNIQLRGATAKLSSSTEVFVRAKLKASEATDSDLLFGLCILKTDLMKTSAAHGVLATGVEGVFFVKVDGGTSIYAKSYKAGTEASSVLVGTLGVVSADYAIWWDGAFVHFYINDIEVAKFAGTLPDQMLTPSFNFRAGSAAARTLSVAEFAFVDVE
jgi:hypothetical protein